MVGAGLLGTSVALACRRAGLEVFLSDRSPEHLRTASGLGAGHAYDGSPVQLVVVAVPPGPPRRHRGPRAGRLRRGGHRRRQHQGPAPCRARDTGADLGRYVGGHPDGRFGALGAADRVGDALRGPSVGGHPPRDLDPRGAGRGPGAGGAVWRRRGEADPRGARPGGGPHLAPAAPDGLAGGRPSRRCLRGAPGAVRAGCPRRHPDRGRRPGALGADHRRQRPGGAGAPRRGVRASRGSFARRWPTAPAHR